MERKIFTDFISNKSDKGPKQSNLFVKICFDVDNNFYCCISGTDTKSLQKPC